MVTQGYVIFKYKGIYYTFNNHSDSYFEHLGNLVVNEINKMINENTVKYYKNLLLRIPLKCNEGESSFYSFYDLLHNPESNQYFTSNNEPSNEYTYIINFDCNKFIANRYGENIYIFNLYDIPFDWYEITQNNSCYDTNNSDEYSESDEDTHEYILNKIKTIEDVLEKLKLKLEKK